MTVLSSRCPVVEMSVVDRQKHWNEVYRTKGDSETSWFEAAPALSLALIEAVDGAPNLWVIDVGGGTSHLVDELVTRGFDGVAVLDLSEAALAAAKKRLGDRAAHVEWIAADVTTWEPEHQFDIWHDRAAFHFLTEAADRAAYVAIARRALRIGGHLIIGAFALDGPEKCSGLPVMRYSAERLAKTIGSGFRLVESRDYVHWTPWGDSQHFVFCRFERIA